MSRDTSCSSPMYFLMWQMCSNVHWCSCSSGCQRGSAGEGGVQWSQLVTSSIDPPGLWRGKHWRPRITALASLIDSTKFCIPYVDHFCSGAISAADQVRAAFPSLEARGDRHFVLNGRWCYTPTHLDNYYQLPLLKPVHKLSLSNATPPGSALQ